MSNTAKNFPPKAPQQQAQLIANGGVNDAINFAVEDWYKAARILAACTNNYETAWDDLKPGVASFAHQQINRLNGAGQVLDMLGYQGVTEVMAALHKPALDYIKAAMAAWNKVIKAEGEVEKIWDALKEAEENQGNLN